MCFFLLKKNPELFLVVVKRADGKTISNVIRAL